MFYSNCIKKLLIVPNYNKCNQELTKLYENYCFKYFVQYYCVYYGKIYTPK